MHQTIGSIRQKIGLLGVCLLLSYCPTGIAATEVETTNKLNQLVKDGKHAEALALANEFMMDYGGEPTFDYLTGLAALEVGEYQQAVFAFERAVIIKPQWQQARFNLAKGYYFIDNLEASKNELEKLYVEAQDPALKEIIRQFLLQVDKVMMDKKRKIKQVLGITVGHDSNINSGSTIDEISSPLFEQPILLSADGQRSTDQMLNLSYMLNYQTPLNQQSLLIGDFALFHNNYENAESAQFESTVAQFSGKYQDQWGDDTYQIGLYYRPLLLDNSRYRDQYGLISTLVHPISAALSLNLELSVGISDYQDVKSLNSTDAYVTFSGQYSTGAWRHMLSANVSAVDARTDSAYYNTYKFLLLGYQSSVVVTDKQVLSFAFQWQKYDYDHQHPFFLKVRDEKVLRSSIGWRYMVEDWLVVQANYKHQIKDSNLPIYAYERDELSVGVVMQF
ncbi:MAG: tetratricopeptide (TPR) repeat protein [Phenylobacterium sp.]|jgi:tetratricopeptide (TPR) repeat protein